MPDYKYFEDFQLGESHTTSGRTMTEADIRLFIGCSDNTHPVHVDRQYCERDPHVREPIIQGVLTLGVADGFMAKEISPTKVSSIHYGHDKVRYLKPVYPGDTIHCEFKVIGKDVKNERFGVVSFECYVKNQNDEPVLYHIDKQMIERKPQNAQTK